jgi:cell envelope opacity-associated protein A
LTAAAADVTKSPYAIVEDEQKSPRIPEEDEESSAEEPDDLPDAELAPFTAKLTKIDATEVAQVEAEAEEDQEAEHANEPANDQPVEPLEPLNTESLEKLLSRAAPIQSSADDEKNFAVRGTYTFLFSLILTRNRNLVEGTQDRRAT